MQAGAVRLRRPGLAATISRAAGEVVQVREEVLLDGFATEAVQSVLYVRRVAGLRHLSVVDDRDPGLSLPLDHLLDRTSDPAGERCFVDGDAVPLAHII